MQYCLFPVYSLYHFDLPDGILAFVLPYRHYHVLKAFTLLEYPVAVDPSMPDVLYIIAEDKTVNGIYKLELPNIGKEIGLHDRYLHR